MKTVLIILGVALALFIAVQAFSMKSNKKIESYPYTVVKKYDRFEIRSYEARLFSAVTLNTNQYDQASGKGFSILAGYIFGDNAEKKKIAMTSPVAMTMEDSITMMFMVPEDVDSASLPAPTSNQINFVTEPAKMVAAIRFGGWANDAKLEKYKNLLSSALDSASISHTNKFVYLGYNPPYEVINRRNEVMIEVTETTIWQ